MAATPQPSDPDPSDRAPLSEHEERALSDLEARTAADDPSLDAHLARRSPTDSIACRCASTTY